MYTISRKGNREVIYIRPVYTFSLREKKTSMYLFPVREIKK